MTAPTYVALERAIGQSDDSFQAAGVVLSHVPTLVSDQTTLNAVMLAAARAGLSLSFYATGSAGQASSVAAPVLAPVPPAVAGMAYGVDINGNTAGFNHVLAHAEYADNTPVALTPSTSLYLPGTAISVPACPDKDVLLRYKGGFGITAAGAGQIGILLIETTSGAPVNYDSSIIAGSFLAGTVSNVADVPMKECSLGPTTTERQFMLAGIFFRDSGSVLAVSTKTGPASLRNPWFLKAVI